MRSPRRTLAATTLALEAFVVFFAALVAKDLSSLSTATAVGGGLAIAVLCLLVAGLLRRPFGYWLGRAMQGGVIRTRGVGAGHVRHRRAVRRALGGQPVLGYPDRAGTRLHRRPAAATGVAAWVRP